MKIEPEFKKALSLLSSADKDKLILRLLRRDEALAKKLEFELMSEESVDERRAKVEKHVLSEIRRVSNRFYSPGYLLLDMRSISGEITDHVKTTKDKYGEVSLNLKMLNEILKLNKENLLQYKLSYLYTFSIYIIARAFKILVMVKSLHEDFLINFEDDFKTLSQHIVKTDFLMNLAIQNGLNVNWFTDGIPDDIADIQKDLRARGYLK